MSTKARRIAIVGGGISGLAAAHQLVELTEQRQQPVSLTLFEASARLGGNFGSERIDDYLIERGADSFITNKPGGIRLCERLGMADRMISTDPRFRRSLVLHRGRPVPTPVGFNLLAPAKIWPMLTTPLLSPWGKLRMASEYFIPRRQDTSDESLASFVQRRFGREMLDRIVQPMVGGIYTSDPERLSLKATLPRFIEMERQYGSLIRAMRTQSTSQSEAEAASGARYGLFATPRDGMQDLLDTLTARLRPHVQFRTETAVTSLCHRTGHWDLTCGAEQEEFDAVILALPAFLSAELLQAEAPHLGRALGEIEYASSAIAVTGHRLSDIAHPCDAFGLVIPHAEQRRILAVSFLSRKFPGRAPEGRVILRTFVGGAMQPDEFDRSDEEIVALVLKELNAILGVRNPPDFARLARYPRGMPQYTVGHLERVAEIERLIAEIPHIAVAGNAFTGVGVPDCIESGERAAESVWESLFPVAENATSDA